MRIRHEAQEKHGMTALGGLSTAIAACTRRLIEGGAPSDAFVKVEVDPSTLAGSWIVVTARWETE